MERYLRVNLLGLGLRLMKKRIYRAAVSQRLRHTVLLYMCHYTQTGLLSFSVRAFAKQQGKETVLSVISVSTEHCQYHNSYFQFLLKSVDILDKIVPKNRNFTSRPM